jgi:hypothetical protein
MIAALWGWVAETSFAKVMPAIRHNDDIIHPEAVTSTSSRTKTVVESPRGSNDRV